MAAAAGTLTVLAVAEAAEDRLSGDTRWEASEAAGWKGAGPEAGVGSLKKLPSAMSFPGHASQSVGHGGVGRIPGRLGCLPLRWCLTCW